MDNWNYFINNSIDWRNSIVFLKRRREDDLDLE